MSPVFDCTGASTFVWTRAGVAGLLIPSPLQTRTGEGRIAPRKKIDDFGLRIDISRQVFNHQSSIINLSIDCLSLAGHSCADKSIRLSVRVTEAAASVP
jgi:hypothetical protein